MNSFGLVVSFFKDSQPANRALDQYSRDCGGKTLPSFSSYFRIYDIDGRCLTNGSYANSKTNTWHFDGAKVSFSELGPLASGG
jgi:hypothetical protein